jgi:hypothetical protein
VTDCKTVNALVVVLRVWLELEDPGLPVPDDPHLLAAEGGWYEAAWQDIFEDWLESSRDL